MLNSLLWLALGLLFVTVNPLLARFKLPQAAVTILAGAAVGPLWLKLVEIQRTERLLTELAVVSMLFAAGYEIRWAHFLKAIKPGILVGLAGIVFSATLGFAASYAVSARIDQALYVGAALAATSIGLSVPILQNAGVLLTCVGQILLAAAVVDDVIALYLLSAIHVGLTAADDLSGVIAELMAGIVVLLVIVLALWLAHKAVRKLASIVGMLTAKRYKS